MSKSSVHTQHWTALALVLSLWVGWKGAKDWVHLSPVKKHASSHSGASLASVPSPADKDMIPSRPIGSVKLSATYARLPLSFEANLGQASPEVKFLSRGKGYGLLLTATEAILQLPVADRRRADDEPPLPICDLRLPNTDTSSNHQESTMDILPLPFNIPVSPSALRHSPLVTRHLGIFNRKSGISQRQSSSLLMKLVGANPKAQVEGLDPLPGKSHYFIGNDPAKWRTNIPTYSKVRYKKIYPGIDLVYYGRQGKLEYDWVVAPGADPGRITMSMAGGISPSPLRIDSKGDLVVQTASGDIRQHKPVVYQTINGLRRNIPGGYALNAPNEAKFHVAAYDISQPLVIDPVLSYSTFLGGGNSEGYPTVALDAAGNVYVTGYTQSLDFPTAGAVQGSLNGGSDIFVTKLIPAGSALISSTYLGGSDYEVASGIVVDGSGYTYVTGTTSSSDFPILNALQPANPGSDSAFITKLDPTGSHLVYSTYLGGSGPDEGDGIAVDSGGAAYVAGNTGSTDFPLSNPIQPVFRGGNWDGFVAKVNPAGTALVSSTYLGGGGSDKINGIALDNLGSAYVVGMTDSGDFPAQSPLQAFSGGASDGFVAKIAPQGTSLLYSTYLGGSDVELGLAIAVDSSQNAYVTGMTYSNDFPTVNPLQAHIGGMQGDRDAFIAKISRTGSTLLFSTYLGGSGYDNGNSIAVDGSGNLWVTGLAMSTNFPVVKPIQANLGGHSNAFVANLDSSGSALVYSTYLGGSNSDMGTGIAVDHSGNAYIVGETDSPDFPILHPYQPVLRGSKNTFIARISSPSSDVSTTLFVPIVLSSGGLSGSFFTSELVLTNRGEKDASLTFTYIAAFGGGSGTANDTLPAKQQRILPDAIAYLRSLGIPIPATGARGGTLKIDVSGLNSSSEVAVTVRTTTAVAEGRAGLAYAGVPAARALSGTSFLCGLRQNASDRSNVAVQNTGSIEDGNIVLRMTVFPSDPSVNSQALPDITLPPGGFDQISGILGLVGFSSGYVRVDRVSGTAPYFAYGVINDQANSDGSFVPPYPMETPDGTIGLTLPVIVETNAFASELVLTNCSSTAKDLDLAFVADAIQTADSTARFSLTLNPGEQSIVPNLVQHLRDQGVAGIGPSGTTYAGALFIGGNTRNLFVGARTATPGGGGYFGLFYTAVPHGRASTTDAWLYGLQQNAENRANLALVNTGDYGNNEDAFYIELYDGATGQLAAFVCCDVTVPAKGWKQINRILAQYAPQVTEGYAHVVRSSGYNPFIAYAIINDGAAAGQRSGDGAFISSAP